MKRREDTESCDVPGRWTAAFRPADRPHHKKPDLKRRALQEAEQKQLQLPLQSGPRTYGHVHREKP
ncbi:hypothetical protein E2C01_102522 [Portunus trituberculatus]|uniref:Uncharacterized protein n=1 Tax=Portunus trituberculatus TaxID=210409 RepID=A0A5B7KMT6_PORTR|nr:hypothetical protein [Portunus trituberculatus]